MISDIRVSIDFPDHPKHKRLIRKLGPTATNLLLRLWASVAVRRPQGVLTGWDEVDIAEAAGWPGERDPRELIDALLGDNGKPAFMEKVDGVYLMHDWEDHQGWACGASRRSETARHNALARWHRDAQEMQTAYKTDANGNALEQCSVSSPSPSPSPSPDVVPSSNLDKKKKPVSIQSSADLSTTFKGILGPIYPTLDFDHQADKCWTYWVQRDDDSKKRVKPNWRLRLMNWMDIELKKGGSHGQKAKSSRYPDGIPGNRPRGAFDHLEGRI